MLLHLTEFSQEPLQGQISRQIRAKILGEDLPAGTCLPSIRALAREHRVSVITVERAYQLLERDGLIFSRRGKGFFVSELSQAAKKKLANHRLIENLERQIRDALAEGLSAAEIRESVEKLLAQSGQ